ncbi:diguanylate cyclase [Pseudoduganella eburnea]|uniref:diguanylate cyclase n=1 Tax=Massilia eburnea TaxID=1776165 RepID=A0A6L6QBP7_9BURK|nr:diguanylate cyclase [Massilia eburnea]
MFTFDVATATSLIGFLSILIACAFRGLHDRALATSPGGQWALSAFTGGAAALITAYAASLPHFVGTVIDNTLTVVSLAFIHRGTAMLVGARYDDRSYLACVLLALAGFAWFTYGYTSLGSRIGLVSGFRALFYGATLVMLIKRPGLPAGARYLCDILALGAAWSLVRLASVMMSGDHVTNFLEGGTTYAVMFAVSGILHVLVNAFQFRLESEQVRDELAAHAGHLQEKRDMLQAVVADRTSELTRLATTDSLTGVANRRHFLERGRQELERAARYRLPMALLLLDIDHFKQVNDNFGHPAGDRLLQVVAQACQSSARHVDLAGRLGGEEFALLMPETGAIAANLAAERLRRAIAAIAPAQSGVLQPITASFGVATLNPGDTSLDALLARADAALYRAKHGGRNRVEAA